MERSLLLCFVVFDGWFVFVFFVYFILCFRMIVGCFCYCWSRCCVGYGWWRGNSGLFGSCCGVCVYCCDIIIVFLELVWGGV